MKEEDVYANHNFIANGDFANGLDDWTINDERKVTRQEGIWQGKTIGFMNVTNLGEGYQSILLALLPRPTPGRADYLLKLWYEAVQGAVGTLRINPGLGGQLDLTLVPSREAEAEPEKVLAPDELLLDLNLVEYLHTLTLDADEETVKFTVISPDNGGPGRPGAVRVAFVRVELLLEPLRLDSVMIDGETQSPDKKLYLCFGARHQVALQLAGDSVWSGTDAGLLVNDGVVDPEGILDAGPVWGREHPVANPWEISCLGIDEDKEIEHTLAVRSQYTADTYPLSTVSGHFQLDVIALKEAAWYPVIDLNQSVELRVRVESHYTRTPLANRQVTWTLKGPTVADDVVLFGQLSDENGEAGFTWTPDTAGDWQIEASVDSHYKKEDARYVFAVRALKEDPWLSAKFALDGSLREWIWGGETGYPCRGATHDVVLAFADGHVLAETQLALHWEGDDTPVGLGMGFTPDLDDLNPVEGSGRQWKMVCGNLRDSLFGFSVSCSKLLNRSPLQELVLAHNWLTIGEVKLPTRFPSVGGASLPLQVQILSGVPGVGAVTGVDVVWRLRDKPDQRLPTGADGWSQYDFNPEEEGSFTVTAKVASPYDGADVEHRFELTVLPENPLAGLTKVTLAGQEAGAVGLLCFRNAASVELSIKPVTDTLVGELFSLKLTTEDDRDLGFHFEPDIETPRSLPQDGLTWQVSSTSDISARFQLTVCHDEITPYELQGRLLSTTLEDEGTLTFDEGALDLASTAYPCLGGLHTLRFVPKAGSLLTGLEVAAKWVDASTHALNIKLAPDYARDLQSEGLEWTLDARDSSEGGTLALALELPQARFTFPSMNMVLGHNRIKIVEVRGPTFDPFVGETVNLEIKSQSHYTQRSVPGLEVSFSHGGTSTPVPTSDNGWARFPFTATQPGNVQVMATVPSPYDGPDGSPLFIFDLTALAAAGESDSPTVLAPTTLADEGLFMSEEQNPVPSDIEIGEVREPAFDPVEGESVRMGLMVRSSGTRRAASGVEVTFIAEQKRTRVMTGSDGWAYLDYEPGQAGNVEVIAMLESVNDGTEAAPSHTFRFKSLAAGVWDDALIQLNTDLPKTVWGAETCFPRTPQAHTIGLSFDNLNGQLLGRDICLGLKGDSSARESGLTVQPALGVFRTLTTAGLSWQVTGTNGGAYALQLEASRLLKQSPVNAMSLGPVPPVD